MIPESNTPENSEVAALKTQLFVLLMALIVVSGTLTMFLYRQSRLAQIDLAQAEKINELVTRNETTLSNFVSKLVIYGQAHPDFQPVLKKYGLIGQPGAAPTPAVPGK